MFARGLNNHATRQGISAREIEQAIGNADGLFRKPRTDRIQIRSITDGGRRVRMFAQIREGGVIRPITASEWR